MIKIAFYSHNIDFAGTWRSHERIAEKLQHYDDFKTFILYCSSVENNRLEIAKKNLYKCTFIPFERSLKRENPESGYTPSYSNIKDVVEKNNIDILHFARSGYYEWPFNERIAPFQIETNIFGYRDPTNFLDASVVIAKCLNIPENKNNILLPNPIPNISENYDSLECLRKNLNIDSDTIVFGRIGRPDNFTPISLIAFNEFRKKIKSKYIIIGACENVKSIVKQLEMNNDVILLDCTNNDEFIERFHKTIDIFAHYRSDGEICSTALAQAMMYKIPVITHFAGQNGQYEWLGDGGFCVFNPKEYYDIMIRLSDNSFRKTISDNAYKFAKNNFDQDIIVEKLSLFYKKIYNKNI